MQWELGDPIWPANLSTDFHVLQGTYWESGWAASPTTAGDAIEVEIEAGSGQISNESVNTITDTVELLTGPSSPDWRRDLIYVSEAGTYEVLTGGVGELSTDRDGTTLDFRNSPEPEPDDTTDISGIPIHVVSIPPGAEDANDLTQDHIHDLRTGLDLITGSAEGTRRDTLQIADTALADGDHVQLPIIVQGGETIRVIEWGASEVDSAGTHSTPPAGVRVALVNPSGSVIQSEDTALSRDEGGIVETTTASGGTEHYRLRLSNNSGSDFVADNGEGISAQFVIEIE